VLRSETHVPLAYFRKRKILLTYTIVKIIAKTLQFSYRQYLLGIGIIIRIIFVTAMEKTNFDRAAFGLVAFFLIGFIAIPAYQVGLYYVKYVHNFFKL